MSRATENKKHHSRILAAFFPGAFALGVLRRMLPALLDTSHLQLLKKKLHHNKNSVISLRDKNPNETNKIETGT
jgi:hypothetical protein